VKRDEVSELRIALARLLQRWQLELATRADETPGMQHRLRRRRRRSRERIRYHMLAEHVRELKEVITPPAEVESREVITPPEADPRQPMLPFVLRMWDR
jgi:hypothetical protein